MWEFAATAAGKWLLQKAKESQLDKALCGAYAAAADKTIDYCENRTRSTSSFEWQATAALLGNQDAAAELYRAFTDIDVDIANLVSSRVPERWQGVDITPYVFYFVTIASQELRKRLPLESQSSIQIISVALAKLRMALRADILTSVDASLRPGYVPWRDRHASIGEDFVGRRSLMDQIETHLTSRQAVVLSGGVGTGKTRLATEYAHHAGGDGLWSHAGETTTKTLASLARGQDFGRGVAGEEEVAAEARGLLARMPTGTIWVIDDLPRLEMFHELLRAAGHVRLLITTRDSRRNLLSDAAVFLEVRHLAQTAAVSLLRSRGYNGRDESVLEHIADAVGRMPLALELLAVRLGRRTTAADALLRELHESPEPVALEVFKETGGLSIDRADGVFNAIKGTLDRLTSKARSQIRPLGYLADEPFSLDILATVAEVRRQPLVYALTEPYGEIEWDDAECVDPAEYSGGLDELVEQCRQESVIALEGNQGTVHSLTTAAIAATNPDGAIELTLKWLRWRFKLYTAINAVVLGIPYWTRFHNEAIHYERALSHARRILGGQSEVVLRFADDLAYSYSECDPADAARHYEDTLRMREQLLGLDHVDTVRNRQKLADQYIRADAWLRR